MSDLTYEYHAVTWTHYLLAGAGLALVVAAVALGIVWIRRSRKP